MQNSMWNRNNDKDSRLGTDAPPQRTQAPPEPAGFVGSTPGRAVIGKSMRIKGDISGGEDLRIDGEMEGTLDLKSRLTIGPTGKVTASIKAIEVVVQGSVRGNVEAVDKITIQNGANIVGDVKTAGIVIEDGAFFKGGIDIARPESVAPETHKAVPVTNNA